MPINKSSDTLKWKFQSIMHILIILHFHLQGYEGSLLKVTSKNGKTASVSKKSSSFVISAEIFQTLNKKWTQVAAQRTNLIEKIILFRTLNSVPLYIELNGRSRFSINFKIIFAYIFRLSLFSLELFGSFFAFDRSAYWYKLYIL